MQLSAVVGFFADSAGSEASLKTVSHCPEPSSGFVCWNSVHFVSAKPNFLPYLAVVAAEAVVAAGGSL